MTIQFDPFRFNQAHEPEPVDGDLPSVYLVDDDARPVSQRSTWFRTLAAMVIAVFLGTTLVTMLKHIIQPAVTTPKKSTN